ncbi:MAG: hypothetical protein IJN29_06780 [Akkermansia sp.]|nr:hypothetical protein [Akkermansia sp.]
MSARVNFEVIAGQRRVSEVRVHGEGGEVLSGPEWTMYGGAICDGFAPVRMRCTEDGGLWRVVLPGLKRGAMPWRWQLFLQEVSTGVEWLVAEGEVRVRERRAEAVDPADDEMTELVCVLSADRTVFEVQLGDATAVAVAAAACAREAAEKAAEARAGAEGAVARHAGDAGVHVTETERKAWNTPLFNAAEAQLLQRLAVFAKGSDARRASLAAGQRIVLTGGGNWLRLDGNGVHIANTQFPAYLKLGSDDDRLAVLPLGVKTAMGADGYGLSVSADGGLQLWGTHFLQGDAHADTTLKIVHNSLSLGSTDTAAIGFDYANTVTFRTFPNDGGTANDKAGGVYRFEAWQWSDDSHTSKEEMAVDVRKPNAGTLCNESLLNRAEVLAAIEENAPVPDLPIAADKTDVTAPSASGKNSTAVGYKAAAGLSSTSLGYNSRALDSSTAVGVNATAEGIANIVVGNNAQASSNDSVAVGNDAKASAYYSTAVGKGANASSASTALGYIAKASGGSTVVGAYTKATSYYTIAVGASAQATMPYSMALGYKAIVADKGATVIGAWDGSYIKQTLLYLIGSGSPLATTYEDGAACLGYVVKDTDGNILECGTRKLSELLTNNTAFAPASMDLDAPAPTPFMPTGITDPIEFPEELENEPEILTDTTQQ